MAIFKCKMCGGDLNISEGITVTECEYCGTKQTLPRVGDETVANLFNRANRLRLHCEFDKAEQIYEKIIDLDDTESEAHWGMILCKYGIEYVEDPDTFERVPTCHRASYEAVTEDPDYISAIENADGIRKELYEKEAKRIEELQRDVLKIVNDEKPFDVFICYKESDELGDRTPDSVLAEEIYESLTSKGYRVFFSRITLEDKLGREYEPYIFAALNSAKVMLVVGTKPAYMEAVWVRNEWSRYLKIMKKDNSKLLIPCYRDMDPYDMPEAFSHLQAQNMQKLGAIQDLVRGIGKIIRTDDSAPTNAAMSYMASANNSALIDNALSYLKDGNFAIAETTCNQVLKADPNNGMAYVGLLMAELKIPEFTAKEFNKKKYKKNPNYQNAIENADDYIKEKFEGIEAAAAKQKKRIRKIIISAVATVTALTIALFGVVEIVYTNALEKLKTAQSYGQYVETFDAISFYKDSSAYATICYEKAYGNAEVNSRVKSLHLVKSFGIIDCNELFPNLEKISFGPEVESIQPSEFRDFEKLKSVTFPDGLKGIHNSAFRGCYALENIEIPNSVISIGDYAFYNCQSIINITLGDGIESIGSYSFGNCKSLKNITLPSKIETIDDNAFSYCTGLENIKIPNSVTIIGANAFQGCNSLKEITLPDSLTELGSYAFQGCNSLKEIILPDSLTELGAGALKACNGITSITIPKSVKTIGKHAFRNCDNLEVIYCEAESKPSGWDYNWNGSGARVVWGAKK